MVSVGEPAEGSFAHIHCFTLNYLCESLGLSPGAPSQFLLGARTRHRWVIAPRPEPHDRDAQWFIWMRANDPSAGSPTETLLRLLLPLSDKVH